MTTKDFDVIILGGGITGAGTQRDCAMRGLRTLLIERSDIATGATGRNHGLLHSGARYAVNDAESAEECIRENMILRKIASHCIDETDGLFITLPEDDLAYQQTFVEACRKAGINAEIIDPKLAVRLDPAVAFKARRRDVERAGRAGKIILEDWSRARNAVQRQCSTDRKAD